MPDSRLSGLHCQERHLALTSKIVMPFEPLRTDEKFEGQAPKQTDFEKQLMSGCSVILVSCFIVYFMVIWPWIVFEDGYTVQGLIRVLSFGAGFASAFGIFLILKFKLAGASGFVGGAMASAVFMFLRMQQFMLARGSVDLPQPEYPDRWTGLVPLAWMMIVLAIVGVLWPKEADEHPAKSEIDQE